MGGIIHVLMTSDGAGGVGVYATTLAAALHARGHRVSVALGGVLPPPRPPAGSDLRLPGPLEWESARPLPALQAAVAAGRARLAAYAARVAASSAGRIDVLHCNQFAWAGAVPDVPSIVVVHSDVVSWWRAVHGVEPPDTPYRHWYRQTVQNALRRAEAVVAPTAAARTDLRDSFSWTGPCTVIPNGSDFPVAPPSCERHGAVCAARLDDAGKQVDLLLQVARHFSPGRSRWSLVGGLRLADAAGDARVGVAAAGARFARGASKLPRLELTLAGALPFTPPNDGRNAVPAGVHWAGKLNRLELARLLARSRIYVAPSRYEPFGLAPLEAARAGCCLLLNDIPSFREIWGQAAYYFARNDASDLRRGLQRLASDDALAAAGAAAAQRRALTLGVEPMAEAYERLYLDVCAGVPLPA